jgi:Cys-tRNA(Pro)/Cys-tRNA(Cys) deacylase
MNKADASTAGPAGPASRTGASRAGASRAGASRAATPALAALAAAAIDHRLHRYEHDPRTTAFGDEVVAALGLDPRRVLKTLVSRLDTGELVVGIVPVADQLDLKLIAQALGAKRATMAAVSDAERSSGYIAGGISPIGQRKPLRTVVDSAAFQFATVFVSAGRRGLQVELAPSDLVTVTRAQRASISASPGATA